jgi:hypothetical protein
MNSVEIYARAVCFTSLLFGSILTAIASFDLVEISFTEFVYPETRIERERWEKAHKRQIGQLTIIDVSEEKRKSMMAMVEDETFIDPVTWRVAEARRSLILCSISIIIAGLIYALHWSIASRSMKSRDGV